MREYEPRAPRRDHNVSPMHHHEDGGLRVSVLSQVPQLWESLELLHYWICHHCSGLDLMLMESENGTPRKQTSVPFSPLIS